MKRKWLIVAFTSLLIVAACGNDKEDKKIEEAQAILKEATQLLDEVKQSRKRNRRKTYRNSLLRILIRNGFSFVSINAIRQKKRVREKKHQTSKRDV